MSPSVEERNMKEVASKVERETSRKYESKMSRIEARLQELVLHNQALTSELSKWTLDGGQQDESYDWNALGGGGGDGGIESVPFSSVPQALSSTSSNFSGSAIGDIGGIGGIGGGIDLRVHDSVDVDLLRSFDDGTAEDSDLMGDDALEEQGDVLFYQRSTKVARSVTDPPSTDSSSSSAESGSDERGQSRLKSRLRSRLQKGGGSGETKRNVATTEEKTTTTSARERLKKVRESLELVASKPIMHQQPTGTMTASNRATISQRKSSSKLRQKQRVRNDLVQERRKIRKNRFSKGSGSVDI